MAPEATPRPGATAAAALVLLALLTALAALPGDAAQFPGRTTCSSMEAAQSSSYEAARIRSFGYVEGGIGGTPVDEPVERWTAELQHLEALGPDIPGVFQETGQGSVRDIHVAGERISVHYPGVPNKFLGHELGDTPLIPGDPTTPTTTVAQRATPASVSDERTFTGATRISMVFTGRILYWTKADTYTCDSIGDGDTDEETYSAHRVLLQGVATDASDAGERWGTGLDVHVGAGSTESKAPLNPASTPLPGPSSSKAIYEGEGYGGSPPPPGRFFP